LLARFVFLQRLGTVAAIRLSPRPGAAFLASLWHIVADRKPLNDQRNHACIKRRPPRVAMHAFSGFVTEVALSSAIMSRLML